ncbi:hypothetical protein KY289_016168 [Solanum tuberosum]|uniref:RING-H2 protein n=1 Tax=Solanum tuberosum TaxID=4113 RepID=M1BIA5_SOLTU|nr:hypothetical protein KY289_016168 [Solanum tuberosum]
MLTIYIRKKSLPDSNYVSRIAPARVVATERVQATPCPMEKSSIEVVIDIFDDEEGTRSESEPRVVGVYSDCCICLREFEQDDTCGVTILNACSHRFHSACIIPWFDENKTCPICRTHVNVVTCTMCRH